MIRFDPLELEDKRAYLYRVIKKYVSHDWGPAVKSQSPPPPKAGSSADRQHILKVMCTSPSQSAS